MKFAYILHTEEKKKYGFTKMRHNCLCFQIVNFSNIEILEERIRQKRSHQLTNSKNESKKNEAKRLRVTTKAFAKLEEQ